MASILAEHVVLFFISSNFTELVDFVMCMASICFDCTSFNLCVISIYALGFNYHVLGFNYHVLGFNYHVLGFNYHVLGFNYHVLGFNYHVLGFNYHILPVVYFDVWLQWVLNQL